MELESLSLPWAYLMRSLRAQLKWVMVVHIIGKAKFPQHSFFAGVPFGFTADEINAWVNRGGGLELWEELYKPFNMKPLPGGNTGTQMFGWFNKEINSLDDIKGLKMRFPRFWWGSL